MVAQPQASEPGRNRFVLLGQLLLIPMVIVIIGLSVFILFGMIASEERPPEEYVKEIRSGTSTRRWQAAWELSRSLRQTGNRTSVDLVPDIISTLEWARNEDPKVRRYLARTLGYLGDPRAVPVLVASLDDPDADTRLWAAEALGAIGHPSARDPLTDLLKSSDPDIRKQAVHSLGSLQGDPEVDAIIPLLQDPVADVCWNTALALARLGDPTGTPILMEMIDRKRLEQIPEIRPEQQELAMVTALLALGELRSGEARTSIEHLSRNDSSLKVRQAALRALEALDADSDS